MRLLLINYEYPPIGAGAANATYFLAKAFHELGHEVSVLTTGLKQEHGYKLENNIHVHRIPTIRKRSDRSNFMEMLHFVVKARLSLNTIVSLRQPEAAIVFFTLPCGPIATLLKRRFNIPYIVSLRGGDVPGLVPELNLQHRLLQPFRRKVLKKAQAIVANAKGLATLSEKADPFPVHIIPNGVDTDYYQPSKNNKKETETTRFLFVGRFHQQKNLPFLFTQMQRLAKTKQPFHLSIIGDGPLKADWASDAKNKGLDKHIHWLGWKNKQELKSMYQEYDCLINPSLYEGMPNVLLEGLASGCPIIASDIPGNHDVVQHNETGLLYPVSDGEALHQCLIKIVSDNAFRQQCHIQGPEYALHHFSWTHKAKLYLDLFTNLK